MNWLYNLLKNTPDVKHGIGAPIIINNRFLDPEFDFFINPAQGKLPESEWSISGFQKAVSKVSKSVYWKWLLRKKLQTFNPDVIHAHFATAGCEVMLEVGQTGIPFVVSFYGYDYERVPFTKPIYKKKYIQLFEMADLFLVEGKHGASILEKMGCPAEKIKIQPLGIDVKKIKFYKRTKRIEQLNLIQAATFTEKKGHIYTLEAFIEAQKVCPNMSLTIIGEVSDKKLFISLRDLVFKENLDHKVHFESFVDPSRFHEYLSGFHVFIHPSTYASDMDCEGGAPVVLLDAQATGMPVISTRHCDIPGVVLHEKTGFLSEERDIQSLSEGIISYYKMDSEEYLDLSKRSRFFIEKQYNVRNLGKSMLKHYTEI